MLAASIVALARTAIAEPLSDEPITPLPMSANVDPERAALGARLFRETLLSRNHSQSCATCHPFEHGGVDGLARAPSASRANILRNTPTVFNAAFNLSFNWDGSARSLEVQADQVIRSPASSTTTGRTCWRHCRPIPPTPRRSGPPMPTA